MDFRIIKQAMRVLLLIIGILILRTQDHKVPESNQCVVLYRLYMQ